jgi:hypothetical protein
MLDMAFGPAHFDVDCFTARVVDAGARADSTNRFGTRAERTGQQASTRRIDHYWPLQDDRRTAQSLGWRQSTGHYLMSSS